MKIYTLGGQELLEIKNSNGRQITIREGILSAGIYFYRITQNEDLLATGNLIVNKFAITFSCLSP